MGLSKIFYLVKNCSNLCNSILIGNHATGKLGLIMAKILIDIVPSLRKFETNVKELKYIELKNISLKIKRYICEYWPNITQC